MLSTEYHLFRAKFIKSHQRNLFDQNITASELMKSAINEKPSSELRKGYHWHIGNIHFFNNDTGYFAIGRTTTLSIEKFDETTGNFTEEETESSPYTYCVFDASIGLIGIAKKTNLAPTTQGIANKIEKLFSLTSGVIENNITVEIRPIPDPDGFICAINRAYRVLRFTATFRGPNPFDADEYFQKPLSTYAAVANASNGRTIIYGDDLNREVLTEVTKSSAATGNEASARIQTSQKQKPTTVNLKGNPIKRKFSEGSTPDFILSDLQHQYVKVRKHDEDYKY